MSFIAEFIFYFIAVFIFVILQAFFRRSLRVKTVYQCVVGNGECIIEAGKRNACSACRLKKCLHVGMSTTGLCLSV